MPRGRDPAETRAVSPAPPGDAWLGNRARTPPADPTPRAETPRTETPPRAHTHRAETRRVHTWLAAARRALPRPSVALLWVVRALLRAAGALPRAAGARPAVLVVAVTAGILLPGAPALAYECPGRPGGGAVSATAPWEGLLLDPARLAPLATGEGVRVAVVDSGVDASHPQLRGRVAPGRDFLHAHRDARQDCVGHGTAVAGIIAARPLPGVGPRGLAPGATVVPVRVSEQTDEPGQPGLSVPAGQVEQSAGPGRFAEAIDWAVTEGDADVISMSLVTPRDDERVRRAVARAVDAGVVVVAAAGNRGAAVRERTDSAGNPAPGATVPDATAPGATGDDAANPGATGDGEAAAEPGAPGATEGAPGEGGPTSYPAAYPGVIGVGAIGPDGVRGDFSQHGTYVDVTAPGVEVTVAVPGAGHRTGSGTSYATPFVAATAALVRQRFPELTPALVTQRILATADPAPGGAHSDEYGYGVVNPYRALTETLGSGTRVERAPPVPIVADSAAAAYRGRRAHARSLSLQVAAGGAAVLTVAAFGLSAAGHRRRRQHRPAPNGPPTRR